MRLLSLFFALSLVACGGSDDSGTSDVDGGIDSTAGDTAVGDAPKDTTPVDTSTSDSSASDTATGDTATDDTATDDTATGDTASDDTATSDVPIDVPIDVPEGSLEAGALCSSDLECAPGLKCCYPCGIPGCSNECIPPGPGGACPLFP